MRRGWIIGSDQSLRCLLRLGEATKMDTRVVTTLLDTQTQLREARQRHCSGGKLFSKDHKACLRTGGEGGREANA